MLFQTISRILSFTKPYRMSLGISILALMAVIAINLYAPFLARDLIDSPAWTSRSTVLAVTLAAMYLLRGICKAASNTLSHEVSLRTCARVQQKAYAHAQELPRGFYAERQTGDLLSRLSHDAEQIEELISHALPDFATNMILVAGVSVAMLMIHAPLALITLATILPVLAVGLFQKKVGAAFREMNAAYAKQEAMLSENLHGIREIQLFNRQVYENDRIGAQFMDVARISAKAIRWYSFLSPGVEVFTSIGQVVVIAVGGYMAAAGEISAGDIVAFLLYIGLFYGPVSALSNMLETVQKAAAGATRVFELLDEPVTVEGGEIQAEKIRGEIALEGVTFAYEGGDMVLDEAQLHIPAGQSVALIGATGSGKTTLLNLMIRLFDPQKGAVKIDGINIREYTLESLRKSVSIVSQDVFLFSGSIYDNIAYAKPSAQPEEVYAAAKKAAIHGFIVSLKDGYETAVGEKGVKLSGGQRQRLAIARALLRDAPILLLDEATSAVDEETERDIRRAIREHATGKTVLTVTHRLTSIADADRVITIAGGKIAADRTAERIG